MKQWCMQCGVDSVPAEAVGVDEDGEPACAMHRLKTSVESAAPSPLPTTKKETAAMKFNDKTCVRCGDVFTPTGARSILCDTCNEKPKSEPKKARKAKPDAHARIDRLTDHVNREIGVAEETPLHARLDEAARIANAPMNLCPPMFHLSLSMEQAELLIKRLLA